MTSRITRNKKTGSVLRPNTSKQIAGQDRAQSVTATKAEVGKARQKPDHRLAPWLKLANLLQPPPSRHELNQCPRLLGAVLKVSEWRSQCRGIAPAEFVSRFERSGLAAAPAFTASLDLRLLHTRPEQARGLLGLAREVAATLSGLARASDPRVLRAASEVPLLISEIYEAPATSRSEIWLRNGAVTTWWVDPFKDFLAALEGIEAMRVRQCPVCNRFFFALRKDQKACSKQCNAVRRVREWRANQAQYEYRRKLKQAGLEPEK
jgi:predicted nucleic acid-binding Zn ribbon protein